MVPPEKAVFGHSILQRSTRWRKRCRNGNVKISQPSVAAWPTQVWNLLTIISARKFHLVLTAVNIMVIFIIFSTIRHFCCLYWYSGYQAISDDQNIILQCGLFCFGQ